MNKKIIISVIAVIVVAVSVVAYYALKPSPSNLRVSWNLSEEYEAVYVTLSNYGDENIGVVKVELIYVPENRSIVWHQLLIVEPRNVTWFNNKTGYGDIGARSVHRKLDSEFFDLLWDSREESDVKIVVKSYNFGLTKTTYTFMPSKWRDATPGTVTEKAEPLRLSVGHYIEYEYNFTGTYVGDLYGTIRAEVTEVDGANYTVRVDYSPTDGSDAWTETFSCLLGEDFMCPLTTMWQVEYDGGGTHHSKVGEVTVARYATEFYDEFINVQYPSKILVSRIIHVPVGNTSFYVERVMEATDTNIEWFTAD